MKLQRVVVAVDGSPNSLRAVEWAADLAVLAGAEVVAVHAVGLLEHMGVGADHDPLEQIRRRFEDEWCQPLAQAGASCRRILRDGPPVSVILAAADETDADLIVLGSRGLGGYPELLLGSTSTQVAQHSHRPVTIVPLPD
ncbi:MAG TPA: universal stress protein [Acidimicrobiales bacterium]|nr:universal stress protein [Acidimicrobiales bacterium]